MNSEIEKSRMVCGRNARADFVVDFQRHSTLARPFLDDHRNGQAFSQLDDLTRARNFFVSILSKSLGDDMVETSVTSLP